MHPLAYTDRHGEVHLPLDAVVGLAKAFAAAEPQTVVSYIDDREEELRLKGNQPGDRWYHDYLRELSPGYALARQWAGLDQDMTHIAALVDPRHRGAYVNTPALTALLAGEDPWPYCVTPRSGVKIPD